MQVFDPRVAWLINDILSDDRARATGFGLNSTLKLDRTAAVKTGTTTNFHDNWTIGYTPDLLVGVWVGNSNYEAMHDVTGVTGAAPIWNETMRALLQGQPDRPFVQPDGLKQVEVCELSGLLPTPACPHTRLEWFIPGTEPTQTDTYYQQVWIDPSTGSLADDSTPLDAAQAADRPRPARRGPALGACPGSASAGGPQIGWRRRLGPGRQPDPAFPHAEYHLPHRRRFQPVGPAALGGGRSRSGTLQCEALCGRQGAGILLRSALSVLVDVIPRSASVLGRRCKHKRTENNQ